MAMAASNSKQQASGSLKPAAMDAAKGVGSRGAFLAHIFLVLSVVTLCAVVYAPRFFVSGPAAPYDAAIVGSISAPSSTSSSAPPIGLLDHVAGRRNHDADQERRHGGALHQHQDEQQQEAVVVLDNQVGSPCASLPNHSICCDRSDYHSDVCFMSGDVRTDAASPLSLLLFPPRPRASSSSSSATPEPPTEEEEEEEEEERIRPYTRKWDTYITKTIHEVRLRRVVTAAAQKQHRRCDVRHDAPVLVVTAGGYSHNTFHVFNDGFLPVWLTAQHLRGRVVLAVLSYTPRWAGTYADILSGLSSSGHEHHHVIDLLRDKRTHCFTGAIVGTRYHDYLAVNSTRLRDHRTILDFHHFLAAVYSADADVENPKADVSRNKPRLGIVSRKGRRVIENQSAVAALAESIGFDVEVMETATGLPLSAVYETVSAYDALLGVHGADLTTFLFLRTGPGRSAVLAQIAPLGIGRLSRNLFGAPAEAMGLRYEQYDVSARESSLSRKYPAGHVVVADPERARREQGRKEWELVEHVYLRGQNVSLDLGRFRETLARIYSGLMERRQRTAK